MKKLMRLDEAAELLGMSTQTLSNEIKAGRLRARLRPGTSKPYYLTEGDLDAYVEEGMVIVNGGSQAG